MAGTFKIQTKVRHETMIKLPFFTSQYSLFKIFLFNIRFQSCPPDRERAETIRAVSRFVRASLFRGFLARIVLPVLFVGMFTGCQNPSVTANDLSELPRTLTDGFNNQRWYFNNTVLRPPFEKQKSKNINGVSNGFFYPLRENLLVSTFNGYLLTINRIELNRVHRIRLARGITAPPAFYRPLVFIASEKGKYGLQAYDLLLHKILWKKKGLFSRSSPLIAEKTVFHATLKGKIIALNSLSGKQLWLFDSGMSINANLAMHGDTLVACTPDGLLMALDALRGNILWKQKIEHHFFAPPMILRGNVYLPDIRGVIWALRLSDGTIRRKAATGNAPIYKPCSTDGERIYLMDSKGYVYCFTPELKQIWAKELIGVPMQPVIVTHNLLLITTAQKYLYLLQKTSGKIVQKKHLKHRADVVLPGNAHTLYLSVEYDHLEKWQSTGAENK